MNRIITILTVFFALQSCATHGILHGQSHDITGTYVDTADSCLITVNKDGLYILKRNPLNPLSPDTLAACEYRRLNMEFLSIKSFRTSDNNPLGNHTVTLAEADDSTVVAFDIPNLSVPCLIEFVGEPYVYKKLNFEPSKTGDIVNSIKLGVKLESFSFIIYPADIAAIPFNSVYGINNGLMCIKGEKRKLPSAKGHGKYQKIAISIPDLTVATFTKMFIHGDFIRYKEDKLYWRDKIFLKEGSSEALDRTKQRLPN